MIEMERAYQQTVCSHLVITEVTAFSSQLWGGYFRLLLSCMMRMIWQIRLSKVSTSISVIAIPPFREQESTAYRYWYALGFLLYHTTQKMSNDSFRCFLQE